MRHALPLLVIACSVAGVASGRESPQPEKIKGIQYYKVEYHRFKPGKADEGRAFIRKHYRPADRAAGVEVLEFTPITGDWDWIAFFPVEADFLAWKRSPVGMRARARFEEMAGGAEAASKLDEQFSNLIQEQRIEIMARDVER
jgi:hypothetical protein